MTQFKVGDKVRAKLETPYSITTNGWEGIITEVFNEGDGINDIRVKGEGEEFPVKSQYFDIISTPHIRQVIVKCPTKKDLRRVVEQMRKDGIRVQKGWEDRAWNENYNNPAQGGFAVNIDGEYAYYGFCWWNYYREYPDYQNYTFLTAQEYLNKFKQPAGEKTYPMYYTISPDCYGGIDWAYSKPKGKIMSIIKNIFKSKEQKALSYYELTNGDGGLTPIGREEFIDYLWEEMKEERNGFIERIVEEYSKEKKV